MYYKKQYRKEIIKNAIIIGFILFVAVFGTYTIYYSFSEAENIDYSSTSLDVTFHEDKGEELNITKITPLPDPVGLSSSKAHTVTIKNNLTEEINYKIKIVDNIDKIESQNCKGMSIPKEEIKVSIKQSDIANPIVYTLAELEEGVLLTKTTKALAEDKYIIRIWVGSDTTIQSSDKYHYHGLIQIIENDTTLAVK